VNLVNLIPLQMIQRLNLMLIFKLNLSNKIILVIIEMNLIQLILFISLSILSLNNMIRNFLTNLSTKTGQKQDFSNLIKFKK